MGSDIEPAKLLLPYLQRADELQKHEPLVAYYCRLYAMERGLNIPQKERTKTTNALLVSLMNQLEKDKKSVTLGPDDHLHIEGFALNIFTKADKQDRAGRADLNTAKTFYAASIFFEILSQFGALQPDIEQKQKYAAWKAADIRKALKEGRRPEPGPPGGDSGTSMPSSPTNTNEVRHVGTFESSQPEHNMLPMYPDSSRQPSVTHSSSFTYRSDEYRSSVDMHQNTSQDSSAKMGTGHINTLASSQLKQDTVSYPDNSKQPPLSHSSSFAHESAHQDLSQAFSAKVTLNQTYPQPYHAPPPQEHHQASSPTQQHYPSHDMTHPYSSYSGYHSYPSIGDNSPAAASALHPTYHQDASTGYVGASYIQQPEHRLPDFPASSSQCSSASNEWSYTEKPQSPASFTYDSSYQPPPDKIAEAHKAARFAVGALAFDDVAIAVDFLRRSLELLTNPSATTQ
ncbi:Protein-like OF MAMMALIAN LYST-INTERACTING PROTEIN 5 [Nymphaea thermarum]|nr:Protein-like OF MAMMALIAN LYST-INTERACTING PROTEIN 5 [Nymphaea thermarum]